jgi:hypothetical protein
MPMLKQNKYLILQLYFKPNNMSIIQFTNKTKQIKHLFLLSLFLISSTLLHSQEPLTSTSETKIRFTEWGPVIQDLIAPTKGAPADCEVTGIYLEIFELEKKIQTYCLGGVYIPYEEPCGEGYAYDLIAYGDTLHTICGPTIGPINFFNGVDPNHEWRLRFKTVNNCRYRFRLYYSITVEYKYPPCLRPIDLASENIEFTTARIKWNIPVVAPCCGYKYYVSTSNVAPHDTSSVGEFTSNNYADLTGLLKNTDYYFWVRSDCDTAISRWEGPATFSTLESCPPPFNVQVYNTTTQTASIHWSEPDSASYGMYRYYNLTTPAFPSGEGTLINTNDIFLSNLTHSTTYFFWVRSDCDGQDFSNWIGPLIYATNCDIPTIPHTQNFDNVIRPHLPNCWTRTDGNSQTTNIIAYTQPNSVELFFDAISDMPQTIVSLPELINISNLHLTFRSRTIHGSHGLIDIGTISDPNNPETFTQYMSVPVESFWQYKSLHFDGYSGTDKHIAIRYKGSAWAWGMLYIDDIQLKLSPACIIPYMTTVSNITYESASINWTSNANLWNIELGPFGFEKGTGTVIQTATKPYLLDNLESNTTYSYYLQTICTSPPSLTSWTGPHSFTTACSVMDSVPLIEDFENVAINSVPDCWTVTNDIVRVVNMQSIGLNAVSGTKSIRLTTVGSEDIPYPMLSSPSFDSLNTLRIRFHAMYKDVINVTKAIQIGTIQYPDDFTSFMQYQTVTVDHNWNEYAVHFTGYQGDAMNIAIRLSGTGASGYLYLDDIVIEKAPECIPPQNLSVTEITHQSALLHWLPGDLETNWNIEVGTVGFTPENDESVYQKLNHSLNKLEVTNLQAETDYEFYVQAVCGQGSYSTWVGPFTFSTYCNPNLFWIFPFFENFETDSPTLSCWIKENISGEGNWLFQNINTEQGITQAVMHQPGVEAHSKLISHTIQLPEFTQISLEFWSKNENISSADTNKILISVNGGSYNLLWSSSEDNFEYGNLVHINLTPFSGNIIRLAFIYKGNNAHTWMIDNIHIYEHTASWTGLENTDWHNPSNWSNLQVPDSLSVITIPPAINMPSISGTAVCDKIEIYQSATVTVETSGNFSIYSNITNNGNLTVQSSHISDGSLITYGAVSGNGQFHVRRFISGNTWHLVSSPISNGLSGIFQQYWMHFFDETYNDFGEYIIPTTIPLVPGIGFSVISADAIDNIKTFTGKINTGSIGPLNLTKNSLGFNLIGNPYPSTLDWVAEQGWDKSAVASSIYIWNNGNWATYNGLIGTNGGDRYIALGQGFMVNANQTGTLTIHPSARTHQATQFKTEEEIPDIIRLKLTGNNFTDETVIMLQPDVNPYNYDPRYDAFKMFGSVLSPQIYSQKNNSLLAIQAVDMTDEINGKHIYVEVGEETECLLKFSHTLTEAYEPILKDLLTNELVYPDETYTFAAYPNSQSARFEFFNGLTVGASKPSFMGVIHIWTDNRQLHIKIPHDENIVSIQLINVLGQTINISSSTPVNLNSLAKGIYLVKVKTNMQISTKKIMLQ